MTKPHAVRAQLAAYKVWLATLKVDFAQNRHECAYL